MGFVLLFLLLQCCFFRTAVSSDKCAHVKMAGLPPGNWHGCMGVYSREHRTIMGGQASTPVMLNGRPVFRLDNKHGGCGVAQQVYLFYSVAFQSWGVASILDSPALYLKVRAQKTAHALLTHSTAVDAVR
jgi:hypothetical protein